MEPYRDSTRPPAERACDLLERMTLDEKIGQTVQIPSHEEKRALIAEKAAAGQLGSVILAGTTFAGNDPCHQIDREALNDFQRLAVEKSRLGIPLLYGRDVIHGHRTVFPIPLAQAASFDPEIVRQAARVAAIEASADGVHWTFAPMVDISRDPRWGRIAESYGEDPFLSGLMGQAAVRGFQSDNPAAVDTLLACAKHFVGYGAAEGGRDYNTAEITLHTLRNIYLVPFHRCCEAGVASVMSAFHDLDGSSASSHHGLLTKVLREEWGWGGFVVSDWGSVWDLIAHGLAANDADAARLALLAGVDMDMCTNCYSGHLAALIQAGHLPLERLESAVRRILEAKFRKGLFENPFLDTSRAAQVMRLPAHLEAAEKAAAAGSVLVKNDHGLLPLARRPKSVVLAGPFGQDQRSLLGCWTLDGVAAETPSFYEAWRELAPESIASQANPALADQALIHFGARAETAVLFLGEDQAMTGELNSVADIALPPAQVELARHAKQRGLRVVAVIQCGRPLILTQLEPWCDAILILWHAGSRAAHATVKMLFGDLEPGGRLPVTFPRHPGQIPLHYNHKPTGKPFGRFQPAREDFSTVAEKYLDVSGQPLYPFGHGLAYTQFRYGSARIQNSPENRAALLAGGQLVVSLEIANTGSRAGTAVPQVYVRDCVAEVTRPVRELKAFGKFLLAPGEVREIRLAIGQEAFGYYGQNGQWRVDSGRFFVEVGDHAHSTIRLPFDLPA